MKKKSAKPVIIKHFLRGEYSGRHSPLVQKSFNMQTRMNYTYAEIKEKESILIYLKIRQNGETHAMNYKNADPFEARTPSISAALYMTYLECAE